MPPRPIIWELRQAARNRDGFQMQGVGPVLDGFSPLSLATSYLRITGTTLDETGAVLGGCTVHLFRTVDDVEVDLVTSDATTGVYEFRGVSPSVLGYYAVAYKAGSPDKAGTTINTLIGTS